jgi:CheY-like chemotaxis protein
VNHRRRGERDYSVRETGERLRFDRPLVLIVDDNEDNRELFSLAVDRLGYRVMVACDGLEAVARVEEERPDVILMDIGMPRMDGFDATRAIRALVSGGAVHIMAVTAFTDALSAQRALAAGCDEVLLKPITPEELGARVRSAILVRADARACEAS